LVWRIYKGKSRRVSEPTHQKLPPHFASLLTPEAYPHETLEIRVVETHISWVLLTGRFAYKIKRPVRYPFVDLRSASKRKFLCEEELRLNRRFAPELYDAVVPVTSDAGRARIGGEGEPIDHAVRMCQFAPSEELAALIAESCVTPNELRAFGLSLAAIHERLPADTDGEFGTLQAVRATLASNVEQLESVSQRTGVGQPLDEKVRESLPALIERLSATIEGRKASGRVRECHGDLHCRNIVRHAGKLLAFDCLEFEPAFRWIDVAHEIAFLYMDLRKRGASRHAAAFLSAYLQASGDYEAARLLPLYGAHCALVRAKVAALGDPTSDDFTAYVDCAKSLLVPSRPVLVLMSGLSGSGKTWLATRVAPELGAIHLRSDVERKRLAGVDSLASTQSPVGGGAYASEMSSRTYRRLAECAADVLAGGLTVFVDATFQRREDRAHFVRCAARAGVSLVLVRCRAPDAVLESRIRKRARSGTDASEADLAVLDWQRAHFEAIDPGEGLAVIDADTTSESVVADVKGRLAALASSG